MSEIEVFPLTDICTAFYSPKCNLFWGWATEAASSYTHVRKVGDICTWTLMDLSAWESIPTTRAGADQPPCSSMEKKLEEDKNSSCVFSIPEAWVVFYWSPTTAVDFHGDGGRELVLHPEFPGDRGKFGQGPTHFHHHTWKHVSVILQAVGRGPCAPTFKHKWPLFPPLAPRHRAARCRPCVMLFTQHTTETLSHSWEPSHSPPNSPSCELLGKCPLYVI